MIWSGSLFSKTIMIGSGSLFSKTIVIVSGSILRGPSVSLNMRTYVFSLGQFCKPIFFPALGEKSYLTDEWEILVPVFPFEMYNKYLQTQINRASIVHNYSSITTGSRLWLYNTFQSQLFVIESNKTSNDYY